MVMQYLNFNLSELIDIVIKAVNNSAKFCKNSVQVMQMFTFNKGLFYRYQIAEMSWRSFQQSLYSDYKQWHRGFCETFKFKCWAEILHDCVQGCNTELYVFHFCFWIYILMTALQVCKVLCLSILKIYVYSSDSNNSVNAKYIIKKKVNGVPLTRTWYKWIKEFKQAFISQLVNFEAQLMSVCFQKHSCIYYKKNLKEKDISLHALEIRELLLTSSDTTLSLTDEFVLEPLTWMNLWQKERVTMNLKRGSCKLS